MALQAQLTNDITPFFIDGGEPLIEDSEIMVTTVAGPDIVNNTVLAQDPSTQKWTPLINAAATDGNSWPRGVYQGETITAAAIQAADVPDIHVIVGAKTGQLVDEAKLVFEAGTLDLDTELGPADAAGALKMTMRKALHLLNIYPVPVQNNDQIQPIA
jgi:hypothetical protein